MKCIECGHELKDGAIFCIRCGAMQVSMDGKPIERGEDWPVVDAQAGASGFRSSTDGALNSAQSKNPRGFQPAPERKGGKIVAIVIGIIAVIAIIAFVLTQCMGSAVSGGDTSSAATQASASATSDNASTTSSTKSTSASSAATSSSAASTTASSASATSTSTTQPAQQEEQPAQEEPSYSYNDYYVLDDTSSRYYSYDELSSMGTYDLYLARNEIYARHGRMFNRSDLQDYFNSQDWYEPIYTPSEFDSIGDENILSDVELKNARLMRQVESDKGSPYL